MRRRKLQKAIELLDCQFPLSFNIYVHFTNKILNCFNNRNILGRISTPSLSLVTLALIFYSPGVWAERVARYLKGWHLDAFSILVWMMCLIPYIGGMRMGMSR